MQQMCFYPKLGVVSQEKYLPASEQPFHRVAECPASCNLVELLAAQIGGPHSLEAAQALLAQFGSPSAISTRSSADLMAFPGIRKTQRDPFIGCAGVGAPGDASKPGSGCFYP